MPPSYMLIVLIIICIIGLICAIWFNCCIHVAIQQRLANVYSSDTPIRRVSTISDNHLFSSSDENYNTISPTDRVVPPIIPIAIGEKVNLENDDGFIIIIAE
jgi:hypothetical protein